MEKATPLRSIKSQISDLTGTSLKAKLKKTFDKKNSFYCYNDFRAAKRHDGLVTGYSGLRMSHWSGSPRRHFLNKPDETEQEDNDFSPAISPGRLASDMKIMDV